MIQQYKMQKAIVPLLIAFFVNNSSFVFSQNKITAVTKTDPISESERWNLDKYVWSHTNYKSVKADKPVLDFNAIENWISLGNDEDLSISPDGKYVAYGIRNCMYKDWQRDSIIVQSISNSWRQSFAGATPGFFSVNSKQYIFQENDRLCFLHTDSKQLTYVNDVIEISRPNNRRNEWLAYQLKDNTVVLQNLLSGKEKRFFNVSSYNFYGNNEWLACQLNTKTKELLIYHLATGRERYFQSVGGYLFNDSGKTFLVSKTDSTNIGIINSLEYTNLPDGELKTIWSASDAKTRISSYAFDHSGNQVIFIVSSFSVEDNGRNENSIWYWRPGMDKAVMKISKESVGISSSELIGGRLSFTNCGRYIRFYIYPRPEVRTPDANGTQIDVWSYKDAILQSAQASYLLDNPKKFPAYMNIEGKRVIRFNDFEQVISPVKIDSDIAVMMKKKDQLNGDCFWKADWYNGVPMDSCWLISLKDASRKYLVRGNDSYDLYTYFSPDGRYLLYFDAEHGCNYFSYNFSTGRLTNISAAVPTGHLGYERFEVSTPEKATGKAGIAAWLKNDAGVLVYDSYDIWQLDLEGKRPPINITMGYGKQHNTIFTLLGENRRNDVALPIISDEELLILKAFNRKSKFNGFYSQKLGEKRQPQKLYMGPYVFDVLVNAEKAKPFLASRQNTHIVKRQSATEAPNYYLTNDFITYQPITNLQPQKRFNWLSSELHSFKQMDGSTSQGILYKPENFDPTKKYPVIVSFYGTLSHQLYQYPTPRYLDAPVVHDDPSWFVSHGYLVFAPDLYFFPNGKWGPSALNSVDGAARYLRTLPFVDSSHLGICGHSNSGRFGYYVLTHSVSFAAMSVGSGTTDLIRAALSDNGSRSFGGGGNLRWAEIRGMGGGMGSLWQNKETWLDHTSVLHADKVNCPVLIFHNNQDGVPLAEAAAMFIALHRLEKKAWWLQYNEGGHRIHIEKDLKDYTIRYTQFFDHYLKGSPAPRWMTEGIPNALKGIEARYELDPEGTCSEDCRICQSHKNEMIKTSR